MGGFLGLGILLVAVLLNLPPQHPFDGFRLKVGEMEDFPMEFGFDGWVNVVGEAAVEEEEGVEVFVADDGSVFGVEDGFGEAVGRVVVVGDDDADFDAFAVRGEVVAEFRVGVHAGDDDGFEGFFGGDGGLVAL